MSAFSAEVTRWQHMPTMLAAINEQAFARREKAKALWQWFISKFNKIVLGDPEQTLFALGKKQVKPILDRKFGRSAQEVVDSPQAVAGGVRKAHIKTGHGMGLFGGRSRAHKSAIREGARR